MTNVESNLKSEDIGRIFELQAAFEDAELKLLEGIRRRSQQKMCAIDLICTGLAKELLAGSLVSDDLRPACQPHYELYNTKDEPLQDMAGPAPVPFASSSSSSSSSLSWSSASGYNLRETRSSTGCSRASSQDGMVEIIIEADDDDDDDHAPKRHSTGRLIKANGTRLLNDSNRLDSDLGNGSGRGSGKGGSSSGGDLIQFQKMENDESQKQSFHGKLEAREKKFGTNNKQPVYGDDTENDDDDQVDDDDDDDFLPGNNKKTRKRKSAGGRKKPAAASTAPKRPRAKKLKAGDCDDFICDDHDSIEDVEGEEAWMENPAVPPPAGARGRGKGRGQGRGGKAANPLPLVHQQRKRQSGGGGGGGGAGGGGSVMIDLTD